MTEFVEDIASGFQDQRRFKMDMLELRRKLYFKYPGEKWKDRVDKMTDNQVIAVSRSITERDEKKKAKEPKQLSLFDD